MKTYEQVAALWQLQCEDGEAKRAEALSKFAVPFAYNSCRIENECVTFPCTQEIFASDSVSAYTGDLRTLFEIHNAKQAHGLLLDSLQARRPLDEALVPEFHRVLTQNTYDTRRLQRGERPGAYKRHAYGVGKDTVGAPPEDVQEEMAELLAELDAAPDDQPLTAAAYFHAKFENIHPFADGNGRTGRLLLNYYLLLHSHPPIVIHEEDRDRYYDALAAWDTSQDLQPLIVFLQEQTGKTWLGMLQKADRFAEEVGAEKARALREELARERDRRQMQTWTTWRSGLADMSHRSPRRTSPSSISSSRPAAASTSATPPPRPKSRPLWTRWSASAGSGNRRRRPASRETCARPSRPGSTRTSQTGDPLANERQMLPGISPEIPGRTAFVSIRAPWAGSVSRRGSRSSLCGTR